MHLIANHQSSSKDQKGYYIFFSEEHALWQSLPQFVPILLAGNHQKSNTVTHLTTTNKSSFTGQKELDLTNNLGYV